jgi:hypothetical protein
MAQGMICKQVSKNKPPELASRSAGLHWSRKDRREKNKINPLGIQRLCLPNEISFALISSGRCKQISNIPLLKGSSGHPY